MSPPVPNGAQNALALSGVASFCVVFIIFNFPYNARYMVKDSTGPWLTNLVLRSILIAILMCNWCIAMYYLSISLYANIGPAMESKYLQTNYSANGSYVYDATTYQDIASNMGLSAVCLTVYNLLTLSIFIGTTISHRKHIPMDEKYTKAQERMFQKNLQTFFENKETIQQSADDILNNPQFAKKFVVLISEFVDESVEAIEGISNNVIAAMLVSAFSPQPMQIVKLSNFIVKGVSRGLNMIVALLFLCLVILQALYESNEFRPEDRGIPTTNVYIVSMIASAFLGFILLLWFLVEARLACSRKPIEKGRYEGENEEENEEESAAILIQGDTMNPVSNDRGILGYLLDSIVQTKKQSALEFLQNRAIEDHGIVHNHLFNWRSGSLYLPPIGEIMQIALVVNNFYFVTLMYLVSQQQLVWLMVVVGMPMIFSSEYKDSRSYMHPAIIAETIFWNTAFVWFSFNITSIQDDAAKYMFGNADSVQGYRFFLTDYYDTSLGAISTDRTELMTHMGTFLYALAIFRAVININIASFFVIYGISYISGCGFIGKTKKFLSTG